MDQLLREFWAAWKEWTRIRRDQHWLPGEQCHFQRSRAFYRMNKLGERIEAVERQAARAPCPATVPDVPGQTYITDILPPAAKISPAKMGRRRKVPA